MKEIERINWNNSFINDLLKSDKTPNSIKLLQMKYDVKYPDFSFTNFYNQKRNTIYHGTTTSFLEELKTSNTIIPTHGYKYNDRIASYKAITDFINYHPCHSLFFGWYACDDDFKFNLSETKTDTVLLKLSIPTEFLIPHGYSEWCNFVYSMVESNNKPAQICSREFNRSVEEMLGAVFNPYFYIQFGIEVFIKELRYDWITDIKYTNSIII